MDYKWKLLTGGHFDFSKMWEFNKWVHLIILKMQIYCQYVIQIKWRHAQPHAEAFKIFVISILTTIMAFFHIYFPQFYYVWVYIAGAVHQNIVEVYIGLEHDPANHLHWLKPKFWVVDCQPFWISENMWFYQKGPFHHLLQHIIDNIWLKFM